MSKLLKILCILFAFFLISCTFKKNKEIKLRSLSNSGRDTKIYFVHPNSTPQYLDKAKAALALTHIKRVGSLADEIEADYRQTPTASRGQINHDPTGSYPQPGGMMMHRSTVDFASHAIPLYDFKFPGNKPSVFFPLPEPGVRVKKITTGDPKLFKEYAEEFYGDENIHHGQLGKADIKVKVPDDTSVPVIVEFTNGSKTVVTPANRQELMDLYIEDFSQVYFVKHGIDILAAAKKRRKDFADQLEKKELEISQKHAQMKSLIDNNASINEKELLQNEIDRLLGEKASLLEKAQLFSSASRIYELPFAAPKNHLFIRLNVPYNRSMGANYGTPGKPGMTVFAGFGEDIFKKYNEANLIKSLDTSSNQLIPPSHPMAQFFLKEYPNLAALSPEDARRIKFRGAQIILFDRDVGINPTAAHISAWDDQFVKKAGSSLGSKTENEGVFSGLREATIGNDFEIGDVMFSFEPYWDGKSLSEVIDQVRVDSRSKRLKFEELSGKGKEDYYAEFNHNFGEPTEYKIVPYQWTIERANKQNKGWSTGKYRQLIGHDKFKY